MKIIGFAGKMPQFWKLKLGHLTEKWGAVLNFGKIEDFDDEIYYVVRSLKQEL